MARLEKEIFFKLFFPLKKHGKFLSKNEHLNTLFLHEMVRRTNLNCSSLLYDSISYVREMCLQGKYEFQTLRSNQAPAACIL